MKKTIALLVCVLMLAPSLASCGEKTTAADSDFSGEAAENGTESVAETEFTGVSMIDGSRLDKTVKLASLASQVYKLDPQE